MTPAPDLFGWRDEADAAQAVAEAEAAREQAARRLRCAPHGLVQERRAALERATAQALAAGVALSRLRDQHGEGGR